MGKIKISLYIILFFTSCTNINTNDVVGRWVCTSVNRKIIYDFKEDHNFIMLLGNLEISGKYRITIKTDSLLLYIGDDNTPISAIVSVKKDLLYMITYKEVYKHIDEVYAFKRENTKSVAKKCSKVLPSTTFIIEDDFFGNIYVHYANKKLPNNKNNTINIPNSGLIKTRYPEKPFDLIKGRIKFIRRNSEENIPFFFYNEFLNINIKTMEKRCMTEDSVYVCVYGYNQVGRKKINDIFNEKIVGNVLMCRVDTLKNLINSHHKK